jgi:hypothetical protein
LLTLSALAEPSRANGQSIFNLTVSLKPDLEKSMQPRASSLVRSMSAAVAASAALLALPAHALQPVQSDRPVAVGEAAAVKIEGKITHVFADAHRVEVTGPQGNVAVIDVDPAIADVRKLKVGDIVHVGYRGALLMSADKVDPKGVESRVTTASTLPASGGVVVKTAGAQVVAVIQKIDPATREVTLAGPKHTVTVQAKPDIDLTKFKVGDSVMATYLAAEAIGVTRDGKLVK